MTWSQYESAKAAWLRSHPNATARQVEKALKAIARKLGV